CYCLSPGFCAGLWRMVLRSLFRFNNCSVLVMREF
ncbi:unnamed protein product, partial [Brassica oleracea]